VARIGIDALEKDRGVVIHGCPSAVIGAHLVGCRYPNVRTVITA
jgi:hypothetical protein